MIHALDVVEFVDDGGQLLFVLDLHHDIDAGVAVGQRPGGEGIHLHLGRRQGHGHIQGQAVPVLGGQLQGGLVVGQAALHPGHLHPAVGLLGLALFRCGVGAVGAVDGHAVTPGDKADDRVAGDGGTALGKLHQAVTQSLHDDARVGVLGLDLAGGGRLGGGTGDDDALSGGLGGSRRLFRLETAQAG